MPGIDSISMEGTRLVAQWGSSNGLPQERVAVDVAQARLRQLEESLGRLAEVAQQREADASCMWVLPPRLPLALHDHALRVLLLAHGRVRLPLLRDFCAVRGDRVDRQPYQVAIRTTCERPGSFGNSLGEAGGRSSGCHHQLHAAWHVAQFRRDPDRGELVAGKHDRLRHDL